MSGFLVMLREGVEASLIVAILLAFLVRSGRRQGVRWVWGGALLAACVSLIAGVVVFRTIGSLDGRAEQISEGTIALVAAGLLTWMIFWMGSRARSIKSHLEGEANAALVSGGMFGLAAVAFIAVVREGLESALFLISVAVGSSSQGAQFLGGLLGLAGATAIGYLVYRGGRRVDLRLFFRVTGILIVIVAAGLLGKAVHEFQEAGMLPVFVEHAWTIGFLGSGQLGAFLETLFGISADPSAFTVAVYWLYLLPVMAAFLRLTGKPQVTVPRPT
jgi:high-affinity iron transporter